MHDEARQVVIGTSAIYGALFNASRLESPAQSFFFTQKLLRIDPRNTHHERHQLLKPRQDVRKANAFGTLHRRLLFMARLLDRSALPRREVYLGSARDAAVRTSKKAWQSSLERRDESDSRAVV